MATFASFSSVFCIIISNVARPRCASAFLKNVCGQFLFTSVLCILPEQRISFSFFSCFPTSPLEFSLSSSTSVITILICRRILFVLFLPFSSFFFLLAFFRAYSQDVEWVSEGHSSPRSSNFSGQFRLSPFATTDASIKVLKPLFSVSLPERTCDPVLLFSFSSDPLTFHEIDDALPGDFVL